MWITLLVCAAATETTSLSKFVESAVAALNDAGNAQLASFGDYDAESSGSRPATTEEQPNDLQFIQSEQEQATSVADEMAPYRALLQRDAGMDASSHEKPTYEVPQARPTERQSPVFAMYRQRLQELTAPAAPRPTIRDVAVSVGETPAQTYVSSPYEPPVGSYNGAAPPPPQQAPAQQAPVQWSQPSISQGMTEQPVPMQPHTATGFTNPQLFSLYEQKLQSHGTQTVQLPLLQKYKAEIARLSSVPPTA